MQTPKFNIGDIVRGRGFGCYCFFCVSEIRQDDNGNVLYFGSQKDRQESELELYKKSSTSDVYDEYEERDNGCNLIGCEKNPNCTHRQKITDTPIKNNQDFGEAIEIISDWYCSLIQFNKFDKERTLYIEEEYQRLLSILSNSNK